eukprot:SAG11_NODE_16039_length_558_cov_1.886710_1_plen_34_part_01
MIVKRVYSVCGHIISLIRLRSINGPCADANLLDD